jgi:uncharacterized membrane protein
MTVAFQEIIELVGKGVDAAGVGIVVVGVVVATALAVVMRLRRRQGAYESYRRLLGRSILLGLEFLVAADIIRTVAVAPTFRSVGVLAVIVLIRTFLSFALELEITGRWPWQKTPTVEQS